MWLHLNKEDAGLPLTKTLEAQTELAPAQYQFKHLSFQEGLFAQHLLIQADAGWEGWETDETAAEFLNNPFMNNTCRIASTRFGSLLGRQRPCWNFSTEESRLQVQGKRALWLLANPDIVMLDLTNSKVGEDFDEAGAPHCTSALTVAAARPQPGVVLLRLSGNPAPLVQLATHLSGARHRRGDLQLAYS